MNYSDDEAKKPDIDLMNRSLIEKHAILTEVSPDEEEVRLKLRLPMNPDRPSNDLLDSRQTCDLPPARRRYDSGMPTSEGDLLQIGVRSDGFDVAASGHRLGSTGLQGGVRSYGAEASGRGLRSSGDESNMLSSDDEFDETSYRENSDDELNEIDDAAYREKVIERMVYFREVCLMHSDGHYG